MNAPLNQLPAELTVDVTADGNCVDLGDRVRGFAGHHDGGVVFVFADGSTRLIAESIDHSIYRGLSTIRGGEIVNIDQ